MSTKNLLGISLGLVFAAGCTCSCGASEDTIVTPTTAPPVEATAPTYDVHEWGLVRGTANDRVMLSGPHAQPPVMPMAKPVLYFHREGDGPLMVDTTVTIPNGRIVEHWPPAAEGTASISWHGLRLEEGNCHGSRYPTLAEAPCVSVADGCEAAELTAVETRDGDCLRSEDEDAWNHLFYRAEVVGTPALPLAIETLPDGRVRLTNRSEGPIAGQILRLRHVAGSGSSDAALVASPPAPGASIELDAPSGTVGDAAEALLETLRAAGLTEPEAHAFRRAWDETLFGRQEHATTAAGETIPAANPMAAARPMRGSWTSIVYVLPEATADTLATLSFEPPPHEVRRVIVAWIDEARAP